MALCTFAENYLMLGVTPVENLFIQEYLPHAPGDYVRVYLYGLMQCYHPSEDMTTERTARILDLPEKTIENAFKYWERQGIVRRISDKPLVYQYLNIASTMANESPMDQAIYRHRDFNNRLQKIFGSRILHPAEFSTACEWLEDVGMEEAVVVMLVEDYVKRNGTKCQFKTLDRYIVKLAEEGVTTEEQAFERIMQESDAWKLCQDVLQRLSMRRKPTRDEVKLAKKWLEEWKLSPNAVMAACAETINGRNPSMGYLDGILKRNQNAVSGAEMVDQLQGQRKIDDAIKAIHEALGMRNVSPMTEEQTNYRNYLEAGFEPEAILLVARELGSTMNGPDMQTLHRQLTKFMARDLLAHRDVQEYLDKRHALRDQAAQVFSICGIERKVTGADASLMEDWLSKANLELIHFAAECARGKTLPTSYISKLLDNWLKLDITTVELARKHHEQTRPVSEAARPAATPHALNYQQRTYREGELDHVFTDLSQYMNTEDKPNDAQ